MQISIHTHPGSDAFSHSILCETWKEKYRCLKEKENLPPQWSTHWGNFGELQNFSNLDICTNEVIWNWLNELHHLWVRESPSEQHTWSWYCLMLPKSSSSKPKNSFQGLSFSKYYRAEFLLSEVMKCLVGMKKVFWNNCCHSFNDISPLSIELQLGKYCV